MLAILVVLGLFAAELYACLFLAENWPAAYENDNNLRHQQNFSSDPFVSDSLTRSSAQSTVVGIPPHKWGHCPFMVLVYHTAAGRKQTPRAWGGAAGKTPGFFLWAADDVMNFGSCTRAITYDICTYIHKFKKIEMHVHVSNQKIFIFPERQNLWRTVDCRRWDWCPGGGNLEVRDSAKIFDELCD